MTPDVENHESAALRAAAFAYIRRLNIANDAITSDHLKAGFLWHDQRIPLVNPQRGIFKPRQMQYLLSIRTVFPKTGARVWYDDQRRVHQQIFDGGDQVEYAFMGDDPDHADNRWLREAFENRIPVIYFLGVSPGRYLGIAPVYISNWHRISRKAEVSFAVAAPGELIAAEPERRYALREVRQRLHQATFRDAVISAYNGRCALSGLPEPRLLDAAHIIADGDVRLGQPVVSNGIPLTKIHHAAFDAHLIGIDPDYRIRISDRLLAQNDGPMLEALKNLNKHLIRFLPARSRDLPDRDRLAERYEEFLAVN
jgi:putative restriction endonuclease